jgi:hypothetical protein
MRYRQKIHCVQILYNKDMKVQRKHESYLEPYRRHAKGCPVTSRSEMGRCQCPIWCYGRIDGRMMRLSCGTRSQDRAAVVMNRLLHPAKADTPTGEIADRANEGEDVTTARAVKAYLDSRRMRDTKAQSLALYERVLTGFTSYCEAYGVVTLKAVTPEHLIGFIQAQTWKSSTKFDRLVLLRSFFRFAMAREWIVASLHRKRLGAQELGRRLELRAEAFSIRRLEGSRWCLRRTLAMGIGCPFGTGKADDDPAGHSGSRGYSIPNGMVEIQYRIGGVFATQRARQSPVMEHTCAMTCGEHVAGPLLAASLRRIEVTALREVRGGESLRYDHRCTAVRAMPRGWACAGGYGLC